LKTEEELVALWHGYVGVSEGAQPFLRRLRRRRVKLVLEVLGVNLGGDLFDP